MLHLLLLGLAGTVAAEFKTLYAYEKEAYTEYRMSYYDTNGLTRANLGRFLPTECKDRGFAISTEPTIKSQACQGYIQEMTPCAGRYALFDITWHGNCSIAEDSRECVVRALRRAICGISPGFLAFVICICGLAVMLAVMGIVKYRTTP